MPYAFLGYGSPATPTPKIGRPRRDRTKIKDGRKAARRAR